jgi:hypothetical protein
MAEPSTSRVSEQDDVNDDNDSIDFYSDTNSPRREKDHHPVDVNTLSVSSETIKPISSLPGLGIPALHEDKQTPKGEESDFDVYDLSVADPTVVNNQPVAIAVATETSVNGDSDIDMDMYDPESVKLDDDFIQPASAGALATTSESAIPIDVQVETIPQSKTVELQLQEENQALVKEQEAESSFVPNTTELKAPEPETSVQVENESVESRTQQEAVGLGTGTDEFETQPEDTDIHAEDPEISTESDESDEVEEANSLGTALHIRQEFVELAKANEADPEAEFQFDEDFQEEEIKQTVAGPAKFKPSSEGEPAKAKSDSESETDSDSSTDSDDSEGLESDAAVEGEDIQAQVRRLMEEADQLKNSQPLKTENEEDEVFEPIPDIETTPDMPIEELGVISNVLLESSIIVVKGSTAANEFVLDHGTVVCLEDRTLIGVVAEPFGKSAEPYYKIGFANQQDIEKFHLQDGVKIYRLAQHSNFVFVPQLLKEKYTDASGEADEEHTKQEFSDDDEERAFKRQKRQDNKRARGGKGPRGNNNNKPRNVQPPRGPLNNRGWRGRGGFRPGRYHDYDRNGDAGNVQRESSVTMKYDDNDDDDDDGYKPLRRPDNYQQLYSSAPPASAPAPPLPPPSRQPEQRFDPRDGRGRGYRGGYDGGRGNRGFARGRGNGSFESRDRGRASHQDNQDQPNFSSYSREQSSSRRSPSTIRSFNGGQEDGRRGRNDDHRSYQRDNRSRNRSRSPYRKPQSQVNQPESQARSTYEPTYTNTSIGSYAPFYATSAAQSQTYPRGISQYAPYDETQHNQPNGAYQAQSNISSYQAPANAASYRPSANAFQTQNQQLTPAVLATLSQYVGASQNRTQVPAQNTMSNAQPDPAALYAFQQMIMNTAQQQAPQAPQHPHPNVSYPAPTAQANTDHASREADDRLRALLQALGGQAGNWQPPR